MSDDFQEEEPTKPEAVMTNLQLSEWWRLERQLREARTTKNMRTVNRDKVGS